MKSTKEKERELKSIFRLYFEGLPYDGFADPIEDIPIRNFEITDIQFNFKEDLTEMTITLGRPGLLIGRSGRTIDGLEKFYSNREGHKVKILIIESKLWS